ncbi:unnamed protein product [Trichogramma brassicae]|uniref:Uncharacterized protein n=1 Tax=Trichogramma brassicae TaxID=86971 RepID=A0A6H5I916_9HYME|nr:unnamed protein product [Trichogramma brassicae]
MRNKRFASRAVIPAIELAERGLMQVCETIAAHGARRILFRRDETNSECSSLHFPRNCRYRFSPAIGARHRIPLQRAMQPSPVNFSFSQTRKPIWREKLAYGAASSRIGRMYWARARKRALLSTFADRRPNYYAHEHYTYVRSGKTRFPRKRDIDSMQQRDGLRETEREREYSRDESSCDSGQPSIRCF